MDGIDLAGLKDHEARNRAEWNRLAPEWVASAERNWAAETAPHWGIWHVPEAELAMLPMGLDGVGGLDVVELGCGTAYWSAWLARRGARPVGVDLSEAQLATARAMQERHDLAFPLLHASAEAVPLPDASFDLAFSEYGAAIWCDPRAWIPEAARLLRPGGWLVFLAGSVIAMLTAPPVEAPVGETLVRPMRAIRRMEWDDGDPTVEFHLPHGEMLDLLRETGFEDVRLREVYAPEGGPGDDADVSHFATRGWARKWPVEEIWVARKAPAR